jgi:DNA replication and checkpoint protein
MDTVKAEIKTWEHEFRARHGRSATIDDVKALPDMGM